MRCSCPWRLTIRNGSVSWEGETTESGLVKVKHVVEKPLKPASNLAIMPVYVFDSNIFKALGATQAGFAGELQLTDGIQKMVDWNLNVYTTKVESSEVWLDIGSPDLYWQAQNLSHKHWSHERPRLKAGPLRGKSKTRNI